MTLSRMLPLMAICLFGCRDFSAADAAHGGVLLGQDGATRSARLQLGRVICGDCCREQVVRAFASLDGIKELSMSPGDIDFTVAWVTPELTAADLVDKLVDAGVPGARISPEPVEGSSGKRWVVSRPRR